MIYEVSCCGYGTPIWLCRHFLYVNKMVALRINETGSVFALSVE
jgi:hypothetical protein